MSDSEFDKITPAELDLNARKPSPEVDTGTSSSLGNADARQWEAYQRRNSRLLWGMFAILLALAAGVVFLLPRYVDTGAPVAPDLASLPAPAPARGPAISPYQEAQLMQQREEAQQTLAALLELQDALEIREVESWAKADFDRAIAEARAGDEAYRLQEFQSAGGHYRDGLAILQEIDARKGEVFAARMQEGAQAILDGEPATAREAFRLAGVIDPESAAADAGLARAQVLDQVLALLDEAEGLREAGDLEAARERYRQALALDAQHAGASAALARVETAILDRDFSALMSTGYASLQAGSPEQAEQSFRQALAMRPDSPDALAGIEQAAGMITSAAINRHLALAAGHEEAERWAQALEEYGKALEVDPNVVPAIEGRNRADSRLNLDTFLASAIANPLRLAEDAVHEQTRQVYSNALRIPAAGPRLEEQLRQVGELLRKAREPVNVTLVSDGLTSVTLYRVGELGQFTNQNLELMPGTYTAVGIREGYRDVREEFIVAFDGQAPVVSIACDEQIL